MSSNPSRHRRRRAQAASLDINKILFLINHVYHVACGVNCLHSANNKMLECKKDCMSKLYQCTMIKAKPVMECNGVAISCWFLSSAQPVASCVPEPGWAFIASAKTCHLTSPGFRIRIQPLRTNRIYDFFLKLLQGGMSFENSSKKFLIQYICIYFVF